LADSNALLYAARIFYDDVFHQVLKNNAKKRQARINSTTDVRGENGAFTFFKNFRLVNVFRLEVPPRDFVYVYINLLQKDFCCSTLFVDPEIET
jgi:hypothetical protein